MEDRARPVGGGGLPAVAGVGLGKAAALFLVVGGDCSGDAGCGLAFGVSRWWTRPSCLMTVVVGFLAVMEVSWPDAFSGERPGGSACHFALSFLGFEEGLQALPGKYPMGFVGLEAAPVVAY